MDHVKLSQNMFLGQIFFKSNKFRTCTDLWKYGQILTIQNSLIIKQLSFPKKIIHIWIYQLVSHYISNPNNKLGMWINMKISILWRYNHSTNLYFSISKVHYCQQMNFLLINNRTFSLHNEIVDRDLSLIQ
jgi:hypothetical protein